MSMVRCDECDRFIDSDDDPACFGEFGKGEVTLCEWCREAAEDHAEVQLERRADFIIRELDEFCGMASNRETVDLIEQQALAFGQIQTRVQLILSFLAARHPTKFKVVSR